MSSSPGVYDALVESSFSRLLPYPGMFAQIYVPPARGITLVSYPFDIKTVSSFYMRTMGPVTVELVAT